MQENIHKGHRKRLRGELIASDFPDSLEDYKILEALLFYGVPRKNTNEMAHILVEKFGSLHGVLEADADELFQVPGVTEKAVTLIKLILPISRRYHNFKYKEKKKFKDWNEVGDFLKIQHSCYKEEVFIVTTFSNDGEKKSCDVLSKGDVSSVGVSVKAIVQKVLNNNAPCVVISHNHIGRSALPSKSDVEMTKIIKNTLAQMDVRLLDHIIVAGDDYISMFQSKEYNSIFR